jgi:hypothetical protein
MALDASTGARFDALLRAYEDRLVDTWTAQVARNPRGRLTGEQRQVDLRSSAAAGRLEPPWAELDLAADFGQLRGTVRAILTQPEVGP